MNILKSCSGFAKSERRAAYTILVVNHTVSESASSFGAGSAWALALVSAWAILLADDSATGVAGKLKRYIVCSTLISLQPNASVS